MHPVYELLEDKVLATGEKIKQIHRTRGPTPYTLYYAMHRDTEEIRLLATISWEDSGMRVTLKDAVAEPCIPEEVQAAMKELVRPPAP